MENKQIFKQIYDEILKHDKIILIRHKNPDYDAYGSQFGLYFSLKEAFKDKKFYVSGDDNINNFLNRKMDVLTPSDYKDSLVILTDQSSEDMLYDTNYKYADKIAIIDHHESHPTFAQIVLIRTDYSSASELAAEFLIESNIPITKESADALFIGISSDSNRFLYKGTSDHTFDVVSHLIKRGADIISDYKVMAKEESESFKRLKGYVLSNFKLENKLAYAIVPKEVRQLLNLDANAATRGTVNLLSYMENCEVWAVFTETDEGKCMVEVRSKEIPVVEVCKSVGGGGHALACGATTPSMEYKDIILNGLREVLK
ncbi:MAG: bifunctional oligoribonuclease/PAP phosphatase NrnA [Gammaproteobacteria bacterium]|nr:bifunctional oligoribonuclease/PAP phosphatase NrnA [Gammaproteobacteria bacterium]